MPSAAEIQAAIKVSSLKFNAELFSLEPSSIVTMFEVDLTNLGVAVASDFIVNLRQSQQKILGGDSGTNNIKTIRLHNNSKLSRSTIIWQGNTYYPAPINAEGFDVASKGVFPKPKISISLSESLLDQFAVFKGTVNFGDLIGAKCTRRRTFAKYLDRENFYTSTADIAVGDIAQIPEGFDPDPYCEFPKDIYYFDRKSAESKSGIEFEMSSAIDLDRVKLPRRRILINLCPWQYRGEGCLYEYKDRLSTDVHGTTTPIPNLNSLDGTTAKLVANENDQPINHTSTPEVWSDTKSYAIGNTVYITKNDVNYYFICLAPSINNPPPNGKYWGSDQCSKTLNGCKLRFGTNSLPYGGFYGVTSNIRDL